MLPLSSSRAYVRKIAPFKVCVRSKGHQRWSTLCDYSLDIDGISGQWNDGVIVSDWDGELGRMDFDGLRESIPNSIAQQSTNIDPRNYDLSNM